jgi:hypothetical protein
VHTQRVCAKVCKSTQRAQSLGLEDVDEILTELNSGRSHLPRDIVWLMLTSGGGGSRVLFCAVNHCLFCMPDATRCWPSFADISLLCLGVFCAEGRGNPPTIASFKLKEALRRFRSYMVGDTDYCTRALDKIKLYEEARTTRAGSTERGANTRARRIHTKLRLTCIPSLPHDLRPCSKIRRALRQISLLNIDHRMEQ